MISARAALASLPAIFSFAFVGSAAPEAPVDLGWEAVQNVVYAEALHYFRLQPDDGSESARSAAYGQALALLHKQPTTRENIDEALRLLDTVINAAPVTAITIEATYLKARVIQLHPFDPNPEAALLLYQDLSRQYPESVLGQYAFVKAAGLRLYDPKIDDANRPFASLARQAAFMTDPEVVRSFDLLLAEASHRLGYSDAFSLEHYTRAYEAGLTKPDLRANVLTRIIALSRKLGDMGTARLRAEEFRTAYPRDIRTTMIEEFLAESEGLGP